MHVVQLLYECFNPMLNNHLYIKVKLVLAMCTPSKAVHYYSEKKELIAYCNVIYPFIYYGQPGVKM